MSPRKNSKGDSLRRRAERLLSNKPEALSKIPGKDVKELIHELQVHQIELEMQNEALQKAQAEVEESRSKYFDLYDLAPVGYFKFDERGMILEANLAGASLLGVERSLLVGHPFIRFVSPESRNTFHRHLGRVFSNNTKAFCEVKLIKKGGNSFYVSLESISSNDSEGHSIQCRTTISDITERKRAEEELQAVNEKLRAENEERKRIEIKLRESENRFRELSANLLSSHERERKLIAMEIHDCMRSSLASCKIKVEAVLKEMGDDNPQAKVGLESIIPIIQEAAEEARRIQMSLRPSMLDDLGILATINWFCRLFEATYVNIRISKEINIEEQEVSESLKIVIYRILQEALNNVVKHSKASEAVLSLRKTRQEIQLLIRDSGRGFDPEEVYSRKGATKGLGLDSMRERTELSGGFFSVESGKGKGTVIRATWPIEKPSKPSS